jgi:transposase-like protein
MVVVGMSGPGQSDGLTPDPATYPGYRFSAEIISHAVWLYHLFSLSLREVVA